MADSAVRAAGIGFLCLAAFLLTREREEPRTQREYLLYFLLAAGGGALTFRPSLIDFGHHRCGKVHLWGTSGAYNRDTWLGIKDALIGNSEGPQRQPEDAQGEEGER